MKPFFIVTTAIACLGCGPKERPQPAPRDTGNLTVQAPQTQPQAQGSQDPVIATVRGEPIRQSQLIKPLIETHGLNALLNIVRMELAKQESTRLGIVVSEEDVKAEWELTMEGLFGDVKKEDYPGLMEQFLQNQKISRSDFEMVMITNTHLRKIAQPLASRSITEEALQEAFRTLYGETVRVRHIVLANMQEVATAKSRISAGEAFERVAREMSRNQRSGALGGELVPFSRNTPGLAQSFKDAAFSLQPGEVSDPVMADGALHLIKMEQRIAPKAVKFEDVKDAVRNDLEKRLISATMNNLRSQIEQEAIRTLKIDHPELKRQFEERVTQSNQQIRDQEQIRRQMEAERERLLNPATRPEGQTDPATRPGGN